MDPSDAAGRTNYRHLAARLGAGVLEKRIRRQAGLWARSVHQGQGIFRLERFIPFDATVALGLKWSGLESAGRRNYLDLQVVTNRLLLPHLPRAFEGFRLLQLSDLHCDLEPALIDRLIAMLPKIPCDAVVVTGDFHNKIAEGYDSSLASMARLMPHLRPPCYAVLGNHDFLEKVVFLEDIGIRVLLNEAVALERDGTRLWICGVDDPHFFQTHDLKKSRAGVPEGDPTILLSHSPETYREAAALGFSVQLSGHTHGGQLCLPGGWAPVKNAPIPRRLLAGAWAEGALQGYTSRGTGGCGVAARFFCPPEVTIHVLESMPEH